MHGMFMQSLIPEPAADLVSTLPNLDENDLPRHVGQASSSRTREGNCLLGAHFRDLSLVTIYLHHVSWLPKNSGQTQMNPNFELYIDFDVVYVVLEKFCPHTTFSLSSFSLSCCHREERRRSRKWLKADTASEISLNFLNLAMVLYICVDRSNPNDRYE